MTKTSTLTVVYYRLADDTRGNMALSKQDHSTAAQTVSRQLHADDEYDFAILRVTDER